MDKQLFQETLSLIQRQVWLNIYDKEENPVKILQLSVWNNSIHAVCINDDEVAMISCITRKTHTISIKYLKPHPKYTLVFNWQ